ncbi:MAG TPA: hypothetical protein VG848_11670 [Acetobacteraceae bacterium]|nr:hypothetical protein [Acetobacteraceae bacterium]
MSGRRESRPRIAGPIAGRLGLAAATLPFHLSQFRHAGLVSFRRGSRSLIDAAE